MTRRFSAIARPLATVTVSVLAAGCALVGSSPPGGESVGDVVLTTRGARTTLQGGPESVAGSVEDAFRVLDIDLARRSVDAQGGMVEGQAGVEDVFVELSSTGPARTDVSVRVQSPTGERWDRAAARGILEEVRRWQGN